MEALKKAEEAKRLAGENRAPAAAPTVADLTLAPLTPSDNKSSSTGSPLPELSLHIDSVDADLAAVSTESPRRQTPPRSSSKSASRQEQQEQFEQEAARNVFSAKQTAAKPRSSLPLILGLGGTAMLVLCAYFWWQLQALSSNTLALAGSGAMTVAPRPAPIPIAAPTAPPPNASVAAEPTGQVTPPQEAQAPQPLLTQPARTKAAPVEAASLFADERPAKRTIAQPEPEPERLVHITKNQPKPNQTIETAYDALLAGQFDLAQRNYEVVLRRDAKNTDALLGLATIAFSRGETDQAYQYYLAALESNPTNATAQAGLITTGGQSDPGLAESRLKTALSSQPDSSALHFALGNLYARQARWSEAQQAYFNAYSIEPDNADFIFNQAVSLDHLHQSRLAAQYYRMALEAADRDGIARPVAFDRQQARTRLQELRP